MVLVKWKCAPEDVQATFAVRVTTSRPTISLEALRALKNDPALEIQVHIRCVYSIQPSRPITIATSGTIFDDSHKPEDGHFDNLALGMLGGGLSCANAAEGGAIKRISFGYFKVKRAHQDNDNHPDLRMRPRAEFLTIPAQNTEKEAMITHMVTPERLFAYADGKTPDYLIVGEKYQASLSDGYVGAIWWCWGDLEDDLKERKLHAFAKGVSALYHGDDPDVEGLEKEGWTFGEKLPQLKFEIVEGDRSCSVEVIA
ncbi:hypothetical protein N0V90_008000 [Kalmusia sp. IMI 367209]|nr:hypothetical protein N0V90_008000 [Kalmusia sp. IMI 367209]